MPSTSTLLLMTALALPVGTDRVAQTTAATVDCVPPAASSAKAQIDAAESDNPDSVDYANRTIASRSPTNDEINAAEADNPYSVDYGNRTVPSRSPTNDEISVAEAGNPDSVDYRNRAIASHSPTNDESDVAERGNPDSHDYKTGQAALSTGANVNAGRQAAKCPNSDTTRS